MMSWSDIEYFRKRATIERALANATSDPKAAAIHNELAERYEALAKENKRPTLHIASANEPSQAA